MSNSPPNPMLPVFGIGCALLAAVLISVSNVWSGQFYRDGGNGESLLLLRYLAFVPVMVALVRLRVGSLRLPPGNTSAVWVTGACYAVGGGALVLAFGRLPVSLVVLILYTFPFVTLVAECCLFRTCLARRSRVSERFPPTLLLNRRACTNSSISGW